MVFGARETNALAPISLTSGLVRTLDEYYNSSGGEGADKDQPKEENAALFNETFAADTQGERSRWLIAPYHIIQHSPITRFLPRSFLSRGIPSIPVNYSISRNEFLFCTRTNFTVYLAQGLRGDMPKA